MIQSERWLIQIEGSRIRPLVRVVKVLTENGNSVCSSLACNHSNEEDHKRAGELRSSITSITVTVY